MFITHYTHANVMQQVTSSSCDICFKECSHHLPKYSKWPGAINPHRFHQLLMVGVEKLLICSKSFANNDTRICTPSFCRISGWNSKTQVIMLANTLWISHNHHSKTRLQMMNDEGSLRLSQTTMCTAFKCVKDGRFQRLL
jgi:hypothetical protein